ncbi:protein ALP1-like [Rhagoletis pomonella]|uniref:protein ALP1-like n=1 Tax=Rhagoletis pomonella TaxID=28610 RepID=UPI0017854ADC|nr:protein ALP1-like [Rhagoletis pomonella]XP_036339949.1 protein ALP1-like [Rhagoletis pomonella]XP_036347296.1 protein ALP1-like [Rhagoletis pomonella]
MENNKCLSELFLAYTANIQVLQSVLASYASSMALYKKRKEKNFIILQHLRRQQLLLYGLLQRNATQRSLWKLNRQSSFWEVNCNCNDDHFFKTHFRMNRTSFETLCGFLKNLHKADTNWRNAIPLQKRVAIALFTLGSSGEYRVVSELFGVGISTVCTILWEFCEEVWQALSAQYIKKLPPTPQTLKDCVDGFDRLGFPQCLGAIDGCHIEVRPNPADATDYHNYKGWYSIVLLAVVDYRYRFLYVNIGAPGRCNDSQIYNASLMKRVMEENELLKVSKKEIGGVQMPICIIGDSAFRFSTSLMKPYAFSMALTETQKLYNYKLSKCRRVVENAFGHLKGRFRRVGKGLDNRIGKAPIIIRACCVLHNYLNEMNDTINDMWLERLQEVNRNLENPEYVTIVGDNQPSAEEIRLNRRS